MYHYDAKTALDELQEEALLPHPVKLRDMILRIQLGPQEAQAMNQEFQDYLTRFGEIQRVARGILEKLLTNRARLLGMQDAAPHGASKCCRGDRRRCAGAGKLSMLSKAKEG